MEKMGFCEFVFKKSKKAYPELKLDMRYHARRSILKKWNYIDFYKSLIEHNACDDAIKHVKDVFIEYYNSRYYLKRI